MNRVIFFIFSLLFCTTVMAQTTSTISDDLVGDVIPPLPNAAGLGEYVDFPVSLYTGIPDVTIPIHTLSAKSLQLPISLSYHGGGVKVSEQSSWVGLAWSLNAGGVITRTVKGGPDYDNPISSYPYSYSNFDFSLYPESGMIEEGVPMNAYILGYREPYFPLGEFGYLEEYAGEGFLCPAYPQSYCNIPTPFVFNSTLSMCDSDTVLLPTVGCIGNPSPLFSYMNESNYNSLFYKIRDAYQGNLDLEPDIFSFNFMGYSGKFSFDKNGEVVYMGEEQQMIIERVGNLDSWIVTATDGTKFFFDGAMESSLDFNTCNEDINSYAGVNYVSSWYLTKVVSATNDEINLYYDNYSIDDYQILGGQSKNIPLNSSYLLGGPPSTSLPQPPGANTPCMINRMNIVAQRLSRIENEYGDKIDFVVANNERCDLPGDSALEYITISKDGEVIKKIKLNHGYFDEINNPICGRLKLLSIEEGTENGNGDFIGYGKEHSFEYNNEILPGINSLARDRWGYYNGDLNALNLYNSDLIIEMAGPSYPPYSPSDYRVYDYRGNRDPNPDFMDAGTLTKVNYPTGGNTTFEYEANTYRVDDFKKVQGGVAYLNGTDIYTYLYSANLTAAENIDVKSSNTFYFNVSELPERNKVLIASAEYGLIEFDISVLCAQMNSPEGPASGICGPLVRLVNNTTGETTILADTSLDPEFTGVVKKLLPTGSYRVEAVVTALSPSDSGDFASITAYWEKYDYNQPIYEKTAGGLRVSNISATDDSGNPPIVKEFEYKDSSGHSSGRLLSMDLYKSFHRTLVPLGAAAEGQFFPKDHYTISSDPKYSMTSGNHIGYTKARVKYGANGSNGWEDSCFSMVFDEPQGYFGFQYPFPPVLDNSIQRGNLIKSETFDAQGNRLSKIENFYAYEESGVVEGIKIGSRLSGGLFQYQTYLQKGHRKRMTSTLSSSYDVSGGSMDTETIYEYANHNRHSNPIKVTQSLGNGLSYITETSFVQDLISSSTLPSGDMATTALRNLFGKNIHAPIETRQYVSKPDVINPTTIIKELISGSVTEYFVDTSGFVLPISMHKIETANPIPLSSFIPSYVNNNGEFIFDNSYKPQGTINQYDTNANILEYTKTHHNPTSFIWNNEGIQPTAKVANAKASEVFYTSFETEGVSDDGNWDIQSHLSRWIEGGINNSPTGEKHLQLLSSDKVEALINQSGDYKLSFWYKGSSIEIEVGGTTYSTGIGGPWTYYSINLNLANNDIVRLKGNSTTCWIDELRLHPTDALMETYCYDADTRQMITSNTVNNIASYYEYDNFHRLEYVRDQDRNILANYEYAYHSQSSDGKNKVIVRTVLTDGLVDETNFMTDYNNLSDDLKRISIQYMDGLGRASQEIAIRQSPLGRDVVSFHEYDEIGRENKVYLPFTHANNNGAFVANAKTIQFAWYANNPTNSATDELIAETQFPFVETEFEASPLSRVSKQASSGESWEMNANHTKDVSYLILDPSQSAYIHTVRDFESPIGGFYGAGELSIVLQEDENDNFSATYTDKQGRTVLVRRFTKNDVTGDIDGSADTYNVYNDFGLLEAVIPPLAVEEMQNSNPVNWDYNDAIYDNLIYHYTYDHRLRLKSKKIPGTGETTYTYNRRDQLVLAQDANQKVPDANNKVHYSFTKYDILGRPIQTGLYKTTDPTEPNPDDASLYNLYETHSSTTVWNGYTNTAFPKDKKEVLTFSYYDNYDYNNNGNPNHTYNPSPGNIVVPANQFDRLDGMLIGTLVKYNDNGTTNWLSTTNFYDDRLRVIQTKSANHMSRYDVLSTQYMFDGKVYKTLKDHRALLPDGITVNTNKIMEIFAYDNAGRLVNHKHQIGSGPLQVIAFNKYNELGQLITKRLHKLVGTQFVQNVDYRYNIRGWLEKINGVDNLTSQDDLFIQQLYYDNVADAAHTPQYNGNISGTTWKGHSSLHKMAYGFEYDELDRLIKADFAKVDDVTGIHNYDHAFSVPTITYDLNGNILSLKRKESPDYNDPLIPFSLDDLDDLTYIYDNNQLLSVTDAADVSKGFVDGTNTGNDYTYDENGNMTSDENKGVDIEYNHLNLPVKFDWGGGKEIQILYDAAGVKMRKTIIDPANGTTVKNYVGGIEYKDSDLEAIYTAEGRCTPITNGFVYEYTIKDHLGNSRLMFQHGDDGDGVFEGVVDIIVLQESHYYPFGMEHDMQTTQVGTPNDYTYNGKELNDDFGLNLHDYGARWYNASIGRFHTTDRFQEKYTDVSPYQYAVNNPIINIDINGDSIYVVNSEGVTLNILSDAGAEYASQFGYGMLSLTQSGSELLAEYSENGEHDVYISIGTTSTATRGAETSGALSGNGADKVNFGGKYTKGALAHFDGLELENKENTFSLMLFNKDYVESEKIFESFDIFDKAESLFHELSAHVDLFNDAREEFGRQVAENPSLRADKELFGRIQHELYGVNHENNLGLSGHVVTPGTPAAAIRDDLNTQKTIRKRLVVERDGLR